MSENSEQSSLAHLVRRYWWVAIIVIVLLVFLCGFSQAEQILKLFNPPEPTEAVTQPPNDAVTEPPDIPTDEPTDNPTDEPTDEPTESPNSPGDGACNASCNTDSDCQDGLSCEPSSADASKSICWNFDICLDQEETPDVTDEPTDAPTDEPVAECSPGWLPAGGCSCCGTTLVCADGTVATFNPACGVAPDPCASAVAGDGVCDFACENYPSEPACG